MRSYLANRDLAIGDARLAADDCRSFQSCLSTASSIGDARLIVADKSTIIIVPACKCIYLRLQRQKMSKIDPLTHKVGVYGSILLIFCLYNRKQMPQLARLGPRLPRLPRHDYLIIAIGNIRPIFRGNRHLIVDEASRLARILCCGCVLTK